MLSIACSLDQRAGLERSRDAAKSQHISGLVEQVEALTFSWPCSPGHHIRSTEGYVWGLGHYRSRNLHSALQAHCKECSRCYVRQIVSAS